LLAREIGDRAKDQIEAKHAKVGNDKTGDRGKAKLSAKARGQRSLVHVGPEIKAHNDRRPRLEEARQASVDRRLPHYTHQVD
jgi:hypothetical protein